MQVTESQLDRLEEQPVNLALADSSRQAVRAALQKLQATDPETAAKADKALSYIWATLEHVNKNAMQASLRRQPDAEPQQPEPQPRA